MVVDANPPFLRTYKVLLGGLQLPTSDANQTAEEVQLPVVDLSRLINDPEACKTEIRAAAAEWGFFQIVGHGVPRPLLERLSTMQRSVFRRPFLEKEKGGLLDLGSAGCYTWGTPTAKSPSQLSWSEAYHIPLALLPEQSSKNMARHANIIDEYAMRVSRLAHELAVILAEGLSGCQKSFIEEKCSSRTCYLRLNRYPPCPIAKGSVVVFGLVPHTDTDFLTVLHQDQVGGLQVMNCGKWMTVKPNPSAFIVNIGDLFQVWSNDVYKSVEHRVVANPRVERFSVAFQLCPSYETIISSCSTSTAPAIYRSFSFQEYKQQIKEDVRLHGLKVGLSKFLAPVNKS